MSKAAIYSRVNPEDRAIMPARKAATEQFCRDHGWEITHFSDSASGNRPPMQFTSGNQLIRPGLTRLLHAVESGTVDVVVPSDPDALATNPGLAEKIAGFLRDHGFEPSSPTDEGSQGKSARVDRFFMKMRRSEGE